MTQGGKFSVISAATLLLAAYPVTQAAGGVTASYLYHLSNFTGSVPSMQSQVRIGNANREVYVIGNDSVKIFNDAGMEIYDSSSHDGPAGHQSDIAADETGNIYHLQSGYDPVSARPVFSFTRCNYKLEPVEKMELTGLPDELAGFNPGRLFYRNGLFYFGDLHMMRIVVTDRQGRFRSTYDLAGKGESAERRQDAGIIDFFVDRDGSILFAAPVGGKAVRIAPDGRVDSFGKRGSAPGRFGVPTSIVADAQGNYLVSDILRSVVIVFNRDLRYVSEFGYRGPRPHNLIGPTRLAIDGKNRLYVSQLAKRGVSVFQITDN